MRYAAKRILGTKRAKRKIKKVMGEFKKGNLRSGSDKGPKVTDPKQGIAISLSEAKRDGKS